MSHLRSSRAKGARRSGTFSFNRRTASATSRSRSVGRPPVLTSGKSAGDSAPAGAGASAAWDGPGAVSSLARSRAVGGGSDGEGAVLPPSAGRTDAGGTLVTGAGTGDGGSVG